MRFQKVTYLNSEIDMYVLSISLTSDEKTSLQSLWEQVVFQRGRFADHFYRKLFELDPPSKLLFKTDIQTQGWKLVDTLTFVIGSIDMTDKIIEEVVELGKRHLEYLVEEYQYQVVLDTFIMTFEKLFSDIFTQNIKATWIKFYNQISKIMLGVEKAAS